MSLLSFVHDSFNQLAKSLKLISIHNLLESHAPSPRKTARTATGRTVATLRTLFIGTAERHEIYFSCLLSLKAKVKKHDRYLLVPNRGKKSLSLLRQLEPNIDT